MKKIVLILILAVLILGAFLFINKNDEKIQMSYEIITDQNVIDEFEYKSKKWKYEIIEKDNYYYVVISYGEDPNYYSKLDVTNVTIKNKNVDITVELPNGEGIGDAFSYPQAVIRFNLKPEKINVFYK